MESRPCVILCARLVSLDGMSRRLVRTPGGLGLDLRWAYGGEVCWLNVLDGHSHFSVRNHRSHCESKPKDLEVHPQP